MRTGRPKADLVLSNEERSQLVSFARSRSLPAALSSRARIVLSSADGEANLSIAQRLKLTNATVGKWRKRFVERRIAGLYDDVRPGNRMEDFRGDAGLIRHTAQRHSGQLVLQRHAADGDRLGVAHKPERQIQNVDANVDTGSTTAVLFVDKAGAHG